MILMDCSNVVLSNLIVIFKNIVNIIWVIGPILAIISLIINISIMMSNPDDKKIPKKIKNCIIALIVLFFIPLLVNVTMNLLGDNTSFSSCWNNSNRKISTSSSYVNPYPDKKNKKIINDPGGYESGKTNNSTTSSISDSSCGSLEYCNKFLTSMYNNSKRLNDAIVKNNAPVRYNWPKKVKTWDQAISIANKGQLIETTCSKPTNWGLADIIGNHVIINSVSPGGFRHYNGLITELTKQYKFDGSMSVKTAIKKGLIKPGDIIGCYKHTFTIYSVNQSDGSAVVFDGGHRFTNKCQSMRKCSIMFTYSASTNSSLKLLQLLRWVK